MSKRRKGKPKARSRAPAIHKFKGRRPEPRAAEGAKPPAGPAARLAAMAAASAEVGTEPEFEVKSKSAAPAPKGGVDWDDLEDDGDGGGDGRDARGDGGKARRSDAVLVAPPPAPAASVGDGVQVVAKGASKFTAADLELLRASIKVKGTGAVLDGINLDELKWDAEGLVPVVAQDRRSGAVLGLGHMSKETLEKSLRGRTMTYWNRTTGKEVVHGPESGHHQRLVRIAVDCDKDALLAVVEQEGPACHRDTGTCFADGRALPAATFLGELDGIIKDRAKNPKAGSHTNQLLGEPLVALKGFVDEANNVTKAVQGKGEGLPAATAELLYDLLVTLRSKGVGLDQVLTELHAQHLAMELRKGK